jgi:hypothetical protein
MIAMAVVALVILTLLVARPWSRIEKRQAPAAAPATQPSTMSAPAPAPPGPAPDAVSPTESLPAAKTNRAPASAAGALAAVQLCRSFSTSDWRCVPAGDSVAPGPIVLYTRVRSPREDVIVHRWYHGEALVKSAQLRVGANATEGYRTYSRQTVDHGDWRVEVRSAAGDLLHEQRFAVQ